MNRRRFLLGVGVLQTGVAAAALANTRPARAIEAHQPYCPQCKAAVPIPGRWHDLQPDIAIPVQCDGCGWKGEHVGLVTPR